MMDNLNMIATVIGLGFAGGFAVSFGAFCGIKLASHLYGPVQVTNNSTYTVNLKDQRTDAADGEEGKK